MRSWYQRGKSSARGVSTRAMRQHPSETRAQPTGRPSRVLLRGAVEMTDDFDAFYRDTSRRLVRYAYGLTGDPAEAQDLVQEAYARAWQRWRRLSGYEEPEAWLRLVVSRLSADRWRRLGVRRSRAAADPPPAPAAPPSEDTVLLVRAMRTLPAAHRRALTLYYLLDRSVGEIAAGWAPHRRRDRARPPGPPPADQDP
ncbi:sigma-70 family RNA polymerase sigma factor [Actinoplanes sp. NPDC048791]|uniref:sigma-70 family RNA polymerase sigma factor n=1 Tax=Actinoplanes sp. NPDC048791 TaxID=3154623 RepID=UPI0033D77FA6